MCPIWLTNGSRVCCRCKRPAVCVVPADLVSLLNQHPGVLESCKTTKDLVLRKGRVMALLATAQEADGSPIPYKKLTEALQVEAPELERVVVEVRVRAGTHLVARLSCWEPRVSSLCPRALRVLT